MLGNSTVCGMVYVSETTNPPGGTGNFERNENTMKHDLKDTSGRYTARGRCHCCKKRAPEDSFSDLRCNGFGGFGVVLCASCCDKCADLNDEQYAALAKKRGFLK